jgi:hypothetical protein
MNLRKVVLSIVKELLLVLVFLSAAWINVGLYQNETFLRGFFLYAYSLLPNIFLFWMLPFFIISFSIIISYFMGGFSELLALILVFVGEPFRYSFPGIIMILIGITIAVFPPIRQSSTSNF